MSTRAAAWRLAALTVLLALLLTPSLALAAPTPTPPGDPCRRLEAAGEVNRRCASEAGGDPAEVCRRLWGTDDWTRRCAQGEDDLVQVCRRLVKAGEWTRRCLPVYPGGPGGS